MNQTENITKHKKKDTHDKTTQRKQTIHTNAKTNTHTHTHNKHTNKHNTKQNTKGQTTTNKHTKI